MAENLNSDATGPIRPDCITGAAPEESGSRAPAVTALDLAHFRNDRVPT
jgi:hypothetical protein